jgi:predicted transcriptional regulator of viral defense system
MSLSCKDIDSILVENNLKKDTFRLIKYSDEIKIQAEKFGNILNRSTIIEILRNLKNDQKVIDRTSNSTFVKYMVDILGRFEEVIIFDEKRGHTLVRYVATYTKVSPYEIALSLLSKSFLSHYSSLYINDLTINHPKDIYINKEQSKKPITNGSAEISQGRIDYAFSKKMRSTTMIYNFQYQGEFYRVHVLNSKNTNNLGVVSKQPIGFSKKIKVTNLERTLIDIVVRPKYSGGVQEILESYIRAKNQIDIDKLVHYLKKFNYSYPYYKSILFFLEYAGYDSNSIMEFREKYIGNKSNNVNFYLDYQIANKKLNKNIGIYYPQFLDDYKTDRD